MTPEPLPSLAELLAEADRVERDAIALRRAFPRAVARVLHLAARAGSIGRRATSLNTALARAGVARRIAVPATEPPVRVADPMWAAIIAGEPVKVRSVEPGMVKFDRAEAVPGPPVTGPRGAVRIGPDSAGGAPTPARGSSPRGRGVRG